MQAREWVMWVWFPVWVQVRVWMWVGVGAGMHVRVCGIRETPLETY